MATGIICEYNPFHNGHIYHLKEVKKQVKDDTLILVLSGNYTQRGDLSIISKYDKTRLALMNGVDLVVLLPYSFATESSDFFAKGSIELLNHLKCNKVIFGSESNDILSLKELANIQLNDTRYNKIVKEKLDNGDNYPTAMSKALSKISSKTVNEPNDILALSYIKEIIKNNYQMEAISIKRTSDYNSTSLNGSISSARSIREALKNNFSISSAVPNDTLKYLVKCDDLLLFNLLKYKIITENDLSIYQTVDEGLENKIKKEILNSNSLEELIDNIKTKRYTYNKIKRMLIHILCSFTKEEKERYSTIKYIQVLGFSSKGKDYLNKIKKELSVPLITNITKDNIDLLELELRVDNIYNMLIHSNKNIFSDKPIIY
ncbi:MAG: nucleotidyltransferase [Bacilli bacterium]|nr:nucleotidyltransferase [Bacilli bacterium]